MDAATDTPRRAALGLFAGRVSPRQYDRLVHVLRAKHYSPRTEKSYVHWIGRYLRFHEGKHPRELAEEDVNRFLSDLATTKNVAAAIQNQALAAVLFLYRHVLEQPLSRVEGIVRARKPRRLPVVLTRVEVDAMLSSLSGTPRLVCMAVRIGLAVDRGLAAPSEGPGLRTRRGRRPGREGPEGSRDDAAGDPPRAAGRAPAGRPRPARAGSRPGSRAGAVTWGAEQEVPGRGPGLAVAVGCSPRRPTTPTAPRGRDTATTSTNPSFPVRFARRRSIWGSRSG